MVSEMRVKYKRLINKRSRREDVDPISISLDAIS